jgi:pilus assembly protein CpaB
MITRRTTLLVAIVLAIGTGWLTLNYLNAVRGTGSGNQRVVLVAQSDIPARVAITDGMLKRVTRPASAVEPDAISDASRVVGSYSLISIPSGSDVTSSKIGTSASGALPVQLTPGKRAISILVDKVKSVSGLIQPGDSVDVIAIPPKTGAQAPPAATILRGLRVLAVGTSLETSSATPSPQEQTSTTVTLEVTPAQADLLAMADQDTSLRLTLRSPREAIRSQPTEALRFPDDQSDTAAQPAAAPQVAAAPAAAAIAPAPLVTHPAPATLRNGVMVINGDTISYVPR